jgi:molybdopterin-guanine dinucleotide biosynthesis protein B
MNMVFQTVDVAGLKKSGKTTVIENLVSELSSRGFSVGTIKKIHIPEFTIDTKGKDTYRHKQAGAKFVISLAPREVAMIKPHYGNRDFTEIEELIPKDTDFLICEELNEDREEILYIITLSSLDKLDETLSVRAVGKKVIAISGVVSNSAIEHDKYPIINSTTIEGRKKLVELILEKTNQ